MKNRLPEYHGHDQHDACEFLFDMIEKLREMLPEKMSDADQKVKTMPERTLADLL